MANLVLQASKTVLSEQRTSVRQTPEVDLQRIIIIGDFFSKLAYGLIFVYALTSSCIIYSTRVRPIFPLLQGRTFQESPCLCPDACYAVENPRCVLSVKRSTDTFVIEKQMRCGYVQHQPLTSLASQCQ